MRKNLIKPLPMEFPQIAAAKKHLQWSINSTLDQQCIKNYLWESIKHNSFNVLSKGVGGRDDSKSN